MTTPPAGKQIPIPSRDTQFATYTVRLGFPVMGIWPDGSDGTDVNALSRSARGDLIVTCDDDGCEETCVEVTVSLVHAKALPLALRGTGYM